MPRSTPVPPRESAAWRTAVTGAGGQLTGTRKPRPGPRGPEGARNRMNGSKLGRIPDFFPPRAASRLSPRRQQPPGHTMRARTVRGGQAAHERTSLDRPNASAVGPRSPPWCWHPPCRLDARNHCPASRCRLRGAAESDRDQGPQAPVGTATDPAPGPALPLSGPDVLDSRSPALRSAAAFAETPSFRRAPAPGFTRGPAQTGTPQIVRRITLQ